MDLTLYLGNRSYSSWSMRIGLLIARFALPVELRFIDFADPVGVAGLLAREGLSPARTVPTLLTQDGAIVGESLAIAEELADRFPSSELWPSNPRSRATARALAAEMHAGFEALRTACPMNLRVAYDGFEPDPAVRADLLRIESLWVSARAACLPKGPWLCGEYSIADAFFAPVAARIATYDLPVGEAAHAYVSAHLADPAFQSWRRAGLAEGTDLKRYAMEFATRQWPS
ncbi:MAG: glutathione S-transferase [Pseudomonadota bacterium]